AGSGLATGSTGGGEPVEAAYRATGPRSAVITAIATAPSVVLIRTTYDRHWRATVDGRPGAVVPADFVDLGVPVGPGPHVIELRYVDSTVGLGVAGSAVAVAALGVAAVLLRRRERTAANPTRMASEMPEPASP